MGEKMIIKRVADALRSRDWFGVALEILIVVVGIFVGLQANSWNAARQVRALEQSYLLRLLDDVEGSIAAQKHLQSVTEAYLPDMQYLANNLTNGSTDEANQDRLANGLDGLGRVVAPQTDLSTILELQSTGNMSIIQDVEIRDAIANVAASYEFADGISELGQDALSALSLTISKWQLYGPPGAAFTPNDDFIPEKYRYSIQPNWELITSDPGAGETVSFMMAWCMYDLGAMEHHTSELIKLRDLLRTKVGKN